MTARSGSSRSVSSMSTTTGTDTDTAATARPSLATMPSWPARLSSHTLPPAPTPRSRSSPTSPASGETNKPATPRPSCITPPSRSTPSSSATRCLTRASLNSSRIFSACKPSPSGNAAPGTRTTMLTASSSLTNAANSFSRCVRPHRGGTGRRTAREWMSCRDMSCHHSTSSSSAAACWSPPGQGPAGSTEVSGRTWSPVVPIIPPTTSHPLTKPRPVQVFPRAARARLIIHSRAAGWPRRRVVCPWPR